MRCKAPEGLPDWSSLGHAWASLAFPREARLLITGGSGFFGRSLLAALAHLPADHAPRETVVLTRAPARLRAMHPELAGLPRVTLHQGDLHSLANLQTRFSHIVHAAIDGALRDSGPAFGVSIVDAMQRVLDLATRCGGARTLFTSSGAVYRSIDAGRPALEDDVPLDGPPEEGLAAYGQGKRGAEALCAAASAGGRVPVVVARCFAFVGEYLGLEGRHAAPAFLRQALGKGPITVAGTGRAVRSYLHAADLAHWLLALLLRGAPGRVYNVGSDRPITILELARAIARAVPPHRQVEVAGGADTGLASDWYVPSIERARTELGLDVTIPLEVAIRMSAAWAQRGRRAGRARHRA